MKILFSLMPPQLLAPLLVLVLVVTAICVMLGIVPRRAIVSVIGSMFIMAFLGPIIGSIVDALPWWVSLILTIVFALSLISWILPKDTGAHLAAHIINDHLHPISVIFVLLVLILFFMGRL